MRSLHLPLFGPMDDITTYFIITKKREKEAELLYTSQSHNATRGVSLEINFFSEFHVQINLNKLGRNAHSI